MTAAVFVDTNVFIYARDAAYPGMQQRASEWLDYLWREQLGRTSVQVLSEYYVNVTRKLVPGLSTEEAWDDVQALITWNPQPSDEALLRRGREIELRYKLSWWDSLIVAAAQLQGCSVLLTEDLQPGVMYGVVTVCSPFALSASEMPARYPAQPVARAAHPGRGRPRKLRSTATA